MKVRLHKRISRSIRARFRRSVLSNHGVGIVAQTANGLMVVDACDFSVSRQLLRDGSYDWDVVQHLLALLNEQATVVFVGCHIGSLLIPIAKRVKRTIGYEADPTNYKLLSINVALNGVSNAEIHNKAIGECNRRIQIARNPHNPGNNSVDAGGPPTEGSVEMTTLDAEIGGDPIDLMVMDIEGYELHAMKGGAKTLPATKFFYVEFAPELLLKFGTAQLDFIDYLSGIYDSMYIFSNPVRCFYDKQWVRFLRSLPQRRGLLMNLLFSNERLRPSEATSLLSDA